MFYTSVVLFCNLKQNDINVFSDGVVTDDEIGYFPMIKKEIFQISSCIFPNVNNTLCMTD